MSTRRERKRLRAMAAGVVITAVSSVAAVPHAAAQNLPQAPNSCYCPSNQEQGVYVPQQETVVHQQTALSQEQLDQILAPIALYPDDLLAQILTASTYPLEVTTAARWSKDHPGVSGDALDQAMLQQPWDASVKGLTAVPQVLAMMSEQLDWTEQLGEAFLAQQDDVTRTVQMLRSKAAAAGTLRELKELRVVRVQAPPAPAGTTTDVEEYIQIELATPDVVRVPVYDPAVVYGTWTYANRRPFFWRPPGYAYAGAIGFGAAVTVGSALWTRYDWRERRVWIDPGRYNRFNRTNYAVGTQLGWRYNVQHRGNAPYRNVTVRREYITTRTTTPGRPVVVIPPGQNIRGRPGVAVAPPNQYMPGRPGVAVAPPNQNVPGRPIGVVTPPPHNVPGRPGVAVTPPPHNVPGRPGVAVTPPPRNVPGRPIPGGPNSPGKPVMVTPKPVAVPDIDRPNRKPPAATTRPIPPAPRPVVTAPKPPAPQPPRPVVTAPKPPAPQPPRPVVTAPKPPAPQPPRPVVTAPKPPAPQPPRPVVTAPKPPAPQPPRPVVTAPKPPAPQPPRPVVTAPKPPAPKPSAQNCRPPSPIPAGWRPAAGCPK